MKKLWVMLLAGIAALSLAACSGNERQESTQPEPPSSSEQVSEPERPSSEPEKSEPVSEPSSEISSEVSTEEVDTNRLVAYFSYAENADLPDGVDVLASASIQMWNDELTGNTGVIANRIAETVGAELFSIRTVEKYPDSYDATINQGQKERNEDARPELESLPENLDQYEVIFLGFPNWWGDMPMALYSFLDEVDLAGKTIVPFVTSGGSGFSNTIRTIEGLEPDATVEDGLSVRDSSSTDAEEQISDWLNGLGYTE